MDDYYDDDDYDLWWGDDREEWDEVAEREAEYAQDLILAQQELEDLEGPEFWADSTDEGWE